MPLQESTAIAEYLAIPEIVKLTSMSEAYWWKQTRLKKIPYTKLARRSELDDYRSRHGFVHVR